MEMRENISEAMKHTNIHATMTKHVNMSICIGANNKVIFLRQADMLFQTLWHQHYISHPIKGEKKSAFAFLILSIMPTLKVTGFGGEL